MNSNGFSKKKEICIFELWKVDGLEDNHYCLSTGIVKMLCKLFCMWLYDTDVLGTFKSFKRVHASQ